MVGNLRYQSGEEVRSGDLVRYHGEPGEVEFVVVGLSGDPATDWYFNELGSGVMVREPKHFGRVYLNDLENDEDLVFLSRPAAV